MPDDSGLRYGRGMARKQREEFLERFEAITATVWVRDERRTLYNDDRGRVGEPPRDDGWTCLQLEFMDHLHAMTILFSARSS